jgi:hypothetical protein
LRRPQNRTHESRLQLLVLVLVELVELRDVDDAKARRAGSLAERDLAAAA